MAKAAGQADVYRAMIIAADKALVDGALARKSELWNQFDKATDQAIKDKIYDEIVIAGQVAAGIGLKDVFINAKPSAAVSRPEIGSALYFGSSICLANGCCRGFSTG